MPEEFLDTHAHSVFSHAFPPPFPFDSYVGILHSSHSRMHIWASPLPDRIFVSTKLEADAAVALNPPSLFSFLFWYGFSLFFLLRKMDPSIIYQPPQHHQQEAAAIGDDQTYIITVNRYPPVLVLRFLGYRFQSNYWTGLRRKEKCRIVGRNRLNPSVSRREKEISLFVS